MYTEKAEELPTKAEIKILFVLNENQKIALTADTTKAITQTEIDLQETQIILRREIIHPIKEVTLLSLLEGETHLTEALLTGVLLVAEDLKGGDDN